MAHVRGEASERPLAHASRTRSAASAGGAETVTQVVVGDRGRLVLPAAVRAELGLRAGSRLLLSTEPDGSLRLRPYRAVADAARGLLTDLGRGSMVAELVAERRAAAAAEDAGVE
jgi:AbrB family looped-hinge helix DNA binding protein